MKPRGFVDPRSPADMMEGAAEKQRRRDGLVVTRRTGRDSDMVGGVGNVDQ